MEKSKILDFARKGFLKDLLFNNIDSVKEIWYLLKQLNISIIPNTVMVISHDNYYSETINKSEAQKRALRKKFMGVMEKAISAVNGYYVEIDEQRYAAVFELNYFDEEEKLQAFKIAEKIKNDIEKGAGVFVSIGIGTRCSNLDSLHLSFKEALEALNCKFYLGQSQVIHFADIYPQKDEIGVFSIEIETNLSVKILSCDKEGTFNLIDELLNSIKRNKIYNPVSIKSRVIEILSLILKLALESGVDKEKISGLSRKYFEGVLKSDNIVELENQVKEYIENIINEIFNIRKRINLQAFEKALEYIRNNYKKNITLEEVSNYVHLSPYYFSHEFKNFTGMNFIDYLTKIRIEKAIHLLSTTDMSVKEVGKSVGYQDPNYFGRVFKKEVGISPKNFKESKKIPGGQIFFRGNEI